MRSIRLSLVVYFLVLLIAALGSVCWLVYRTAETALEERRRAAQLQVEGQFKTHRDEVEASLDRRLLRQAQTVATMARSPLHLEGLYPLGLLGTPFAAQGHLHLPLWLAEASHKGLREKLFRLRSSEIDVDAAEDLIPPVQAGHAREYFQVYLGDGQSSQRSQSLGEQALRLPALPAPSEPWLEVFDTVKLEPSGVTVRRVTLKAALTRYRHGGFPPWLWLRGPGRGGPFPKSRPTKAAPPPRPFFVDTEAPTIFVQYAIDLGPTTAHLQEAAADRGQQIAQLQEDTAAQLQAVRSRLLWIALLTFAFTVAGGYLLLRLGLAPLARLSEAVSEVSERDFRLKLHLHSLPAELQPIADRLSRTLTQLSKAFDREKHAAADISHELRTPLAALLTSVDVALRKPRSAGEYREVLEECRSSGGQMQMLVERLLTLARLDAGADRPRPRAVDAADLTMQCADLIRPLARERGLTLTAHVVPPLLVETDADKLREVLTNLLHNAVEYNRPGGTIDVTVDRDGGALCVEVRDTGVGISPELRERIFERFYRADPSRHADTPHAGLGLAIVKSYVDLLGGTITVASVPNEGSTFRVRLPAPVMAPKLVPA